MRRELGFLLSTFRARTEATGTELWVTDGTPAGTSLLKDILPGPGDGVRPAFFN
jgi:ELWxxDGT repeat protein